MQPVVVELVGAPVVTPLRHAVLRPGQPAEASRYPDDDEPGTAHAAVRMPGHSGPPGDGDGPVAVGTALVEPPPWEPDRADGWRIRGMATRPDLRGRGLGGLVLDALVDHVAGHGGGLVWCNARVTARQFYERAGFVTRGKVFDVPGIGPHVRMWRTVGPLGRSVTDADPLTDDPETGEHPEL